MHAWKAAARIAVVAATALLGCYEPTGPAGPPELLLTGAFGFFPVTPAGGGLELHLTASGGRIAGDGKEYRFCCFYDSFVVSGSYSETSASFELGIRYSKGPTGSYVGHALGPDGITGTWTVSDGYPPAQLTFSREPVPPCSDSAPLLGTFDPAAPGYIVRFRDSVNADSEATLLAERYGFTVQSVYQVTIKGFAAQVSRPTVAVLRCEPAVASVSYDSVVTAG